MVDLLTQIAEGVRKEAENYAEEEGYDSDLCGLCAIASVWLFQDLKKNGFKPIICVSREKDTWGCWHVYLEVDGYVVDITATQFNISDGVEIHHVNHSGEILLRAGRSNFWYWRPYKQFKTIEGLVAFMKRAGWMESEIPTLTNEN